VPEDAAATVPTASSAAATEATEFPASPRSVTLGPAEFTTGGKHAARFRLVNPADDGSVLHVRLAPGAAWIAGVLPSEAALGPGEQQTVSVTIDADEGRRVVRDGGAPSAPVRLLYQRLFAENGSNNGGEREAAVYVHLPVATCPACHRSLEAAVGRDGAHAVPEVCPYCFERLRPCPVCGAPNSWLARQCAQDSSHVVRASPDWGMLGGGSAHDGSRAAGRATTGLARRWSFPSVPPARRENRLAWSAPVAAYGLIAAAAATADGDAHLYAFDARTGAPMWEPYPLPDPVYPDRGGAAIAGGRIWAATVDGACVCVDALRGTRLWEVSLPGHVYGAVVPTGEDGKRLLVPAATDDGRGCLFLMDGEHGTVLHQTPLVGPPDSAPAFADGRAFVHDDSGALTCVDAETGAVVWTAACGAGFDSAPVVRDGKVISTTSGGVVWCRDAATGEETWRLTVTNAPFGGTPAHDGLLVYLPADDGLHLVSAGTGRAVRRHPTLQPVRSAPVVLDGALLFGSTDGNVYGAPAGRGLEKLYETGTTGSQIIAAPAVADGGFFVAATNGVLYALTVVEAAAVTPPTDQGAGRAV
jgi:outer membrane protein assembly factor BamB